MIAANVSGDETSSGSLVLSCPWNASGILCLSANGAVRFAMLTCVDVEMAFTPSAFAIMNAYSISSSLVFLTFILKQRIRRSMPAPWIFFFTGLNVAAVADIRTF